MKTERKTIMIAFPPQWLPINPYLSAPLLAGQLKRAGYPVICRDENIAFYDAVLNAEYLQECREEIAKTDAAYPLERYARCIDEIGQAVQTVKHGKDFYVLSRYERAMEILEESLQLVSKRYEPQQISLYGFFDPRFNWSYRNLLRITSGEKRNMFYDYYANMVEEMRSWEYGAICITIPCYTQLIPALTFSRLVKEHTNIPVCIGGNMITRLRNGILADKDILDTFCDYLLMGDGEESIVQFADYLSGKCGPEDVAGMVWKDGYEIFSNPSAGCPDMNKVAPPYFGGMDLTQYYSPEPCIAIEFTKGCYWGKCSFCAVDVSKKKYAMKDVSSFVDEVEHLVEQEGIRNFVFTDEAIPVKKYLAFAEKVLRRGLRIHFYSFARLEKDYTPEVLSKLYEAGLRILWWGYESKSERIMGLMNKGIDLGERTRILQDAYDAGIWNHGLCMVGFPTETLEEVQETFREIRAHRRLFNSCAVNTFFLSYNSLMYLHPKDYGITSISVPNAFNSHCAFKTKSFSEQEYRQMAEQFKREYLAENSHTLWPMIYDNFDHLLLYLKRYGTKQIREYDARAGKPLLPLQPDGCE